MILKIKITKTFNYDYDIDIDDLNIVCFEENNNGNDNIICFDIDVNIENIKNNNIIFHLSDYSWMYIYISIQNNYDHLKKVNNIKENDWIKVFKKL